jgi:hypothetical protein
VVLCERVSVAQRGTAWHSVAQQVLQGSCVCVQVVYLVD